MNEKEKMLNVYIPESLLNDIKALAAREGTSIKKIVNSELEEYCKIHKEGNPQHVLDSFWLNEDFYGFPSIAINKTKKAEWLNSKNITAKDKEALFWHIQEYKTELEKQGFTF